MTATVVAAAIVDKSRQGTKATLSASGLHGYTLVLDARDVRESRVVIGADPDISSEASVRGEDIKKPS